MKPADAPLAARHAQLEKDLNAMQARYRKIPDVPLLTATVPHRSLKDRLMELKLRRQKKNQLPPPQNFREQKAADAAHAERIRQRYNTKLTLLLVAFLYLAICGFVVHVQWIIRLIF